MSKYSNHTVSKVFAILIPVLTFVMGQVVQYLYYKSTSTVILLKSIFPHIPIQVLLISAVINLINTILIACQAWKWADNGERASCWMYIIFNGLFLLIVPCIGSIVGIIITSVITRLAYNPHNTHIVPVMICAYLVFIGLGGWVGVVNNSFNFINKNGCNHNFILEERIVATCTQEGYTKFKCNKCRLTYDEIIPIKEHIAGEAPTLDSSQVCIACGTLLGNAVDYMSYRGNDLAINHYYNCNKSFITTNIVSQNLGRHVPPTIPYVDKRGNPCYLQLSIPVQDFFTHSVSSVLPLSTLDGKTYNTDSGFKINFSFSSLNKDVTSIHTWEKGLSNEYENADMDLLKIVGKYQATPVYFNNIWELVDFSDCYIEISKQTETGYKVIKRIDSSEDWKSIIQSGSVEISNDNNALFYEVGTYRVLFKYSMTWITDPSSAVYDLSDIEKKNGIYPYGKINDQYEFFYITVTGEKNNILLPSINEIPNFGFFCQLRAVTSKESNSFVAENSTIQFEDHPIFKISAKVDMTRNGYYYNKNKIEDFSIKFFSYNSDTDSYNEHSAYNLMSSISQDIVYGNEIMVDIGQATPLRDSKCKIELSCSFLNEETGEMIVEQQVYYYTLSW